jgi:hypothetical protein
MVPGFNFVANPLTTTNDDLSILNVHVIPDQTQVYVWDVNNQKFLLPATFTANPPNGGTWDTDFSLPPGRGFVVYTDQPWTNTFVGNVAGCGATNHNLVAGNNKFSLLGSQLPLAGVVMTNANFNFQGTDGDAIYLFKTNQAYSDAFSFFANYGWFDPKGTTNGPVLAVGQSFFIQHPGPDYDWTQSLPPPFAAAAPNAAPSPTTLEVSSLRMSDQKTILQIEHHGAQYDVQFSTDAVVWTTIAANRTGPIWTGPRRSSAHGYFRVVVAGKSKGGL